eukprot:825325_1
MTSLSLSEPPLPEMAFINPLAVPDFKPQIIPGAVVQTDSSLINPLASPLTNPVPNASPTQAVMTKYRREHDRLLPIANIGRIMQRACPLLIQGFPPCKISKEA